LDLQLLGVSRDFELEADNLGIQYAWNAGYDPEGFIRFFDKMANKHGYAIGASWFRTHPPFYQRILQSKREITFPGPKEQMILHTTQFEEMKLVLAPVSAEAKKKENEYRPTLYRTAKESCTAPPPLYKSEDPIETICAQFGPGK
jgi:predicted Zn-dependent protease